jgi:hypothetical protein
MEELVENTEATEPQLNMAELGRSVIIPAQARLRREALAAERTLKGFYMSWCFDQLNLARFK